MRRNPVGVALLVATILTGCTSTTEVTSKPTHEQSLIEAVEKDGKDHVAWFNLGQFYYDGGEYEKAAKAYERGNALMCPDALSARYTGGYFCLALTYVHMKPPRYDLALKNLDAIAQLEPADAKTASHNSNFREAHRIRGAIYLSNNKARSARAELLKYLELGGDEDAVADALETLKGLE